MWNIIWQSQTENLGASTDGKIINYYKRETEKFFFSSLRVDGYIESQKTLIQKGNA